MVGIDCQCNGPAVLPIARRNFRAQIRPSFMAGMRLQRLSILWHKQNAAFLMQVCETNRIIRTHWSRDDYLSALCRISSYHAAMAAKYRHTARFPWLPVEPDPPEPE